MGLVHASTHAYLHVFPHMHTYIRTCMRTPTCISLHRCTHTHMYTYSLPSRLKVCKSHRVVVRSRVATYARVAMRNAHVHMHMLRAGVHGVGMHMYICTCCVRVCMVWVCTCRGDHSGESHVAKDHMYICTCTYAPVGATTLVSLTWPRTTIVPVRVVRGQRSSGTLSLW